MAEDLAKSGLYIDDFYTLRVLDPEITNETTDLKEECLNFADKLSDFTTIAETFIEIAENYAKQVEEAKLRTVATLNKVNTMSKQREQEQQQIQNQIIEAMVELDRMKIEYQYLQRIESEQQEFMDSLLQNQ